jgi:hypothetical protein
VSCADLSEEDDFDDWCLKQAAEYGFLEVDKFILPGGKVKTGFRMTERGEFWLMLLRYYAREFANEGIGCWKALPAEAMRQQ